MSFLPFAVILATIYGFVNFGYVKATGVAIYAILKWDGPSAFILVAISMLLFIGIFWLFTTVQVRLFDCLVLPFFFLSFKLIKLGSAESFIELVPILMIFFFHICTQTRRDLQLGRRKDTDDRPDNWRNALDLFKTN